LSTPPLFSTPKEKDFQHTGDRIMQAILRVGLLMMQAG